MNMIIKSKCNIQVKQCTSHARSQKSDHEVTARRLPTGLDTAALHDYRYDVEHQSNDGSGQEDMVHRFIAVITFSRFMNRSKYTFYFAKYLFFDRNFLHTLDEVTAEL